MEKKTREDIDKSMSVLKEMVSNIAKACDKTKLLIVGCFSLNAKLENEGLVGADRFTQDIDLSILDFDTYKNLFDNIEEILNSSTDGYYSVTKRRGFNNSFGSDSVNLNYVENGINMKVKIDINIKDIKEDDKLWLPNVELPVCSNYYALVDKVAVVCSNKVFRRIKDLYDMCTIVSSFDISYIKLVNKIRERRPEFFNSHINMLIDDNYNDLFHAYNSNSSMDKSFDNVLSVSLMFLLPFLHMIEKGDYREMNWLSSVKSWYRKE